MLTDVSETRCAQQRIGDCMRNNIGIAVADQYSFTGKRNSPENQRAAVNRLIRKTMNVETLTDSNLHHHTSPCRR
jgi:hypothetical protein